jgi:hypothetical protein
MMDADKNLMAAAEIKFFSIRSAELPSRKKVEIKRTLAICMKSNTQFFWPRSIGYTAKLDTLNSKKVLHDDIFTQGLINDFTFAAFRVL